ncbi:hypothetical protein KR222_009712, partial [Zaprionus bogoriensis]
IMSSSDNIAQCPYPVPKATAAQSVPGAVLSGTRTASETSFCDEYENQLLNANKSLHGHAKNGSACSAPGPGLLTNGDSANDSHMRWWW